MNGLKMRVHLSKPVFVSAVLMLLALVGTSMSPAAAHAAALSHPSCNSSEIAVSAGETETNTTYPVKTSTGIHEVPAFEVVPVYFYNRGTVCHLSMGAPDIEVVRNTTKVVNLSALSAHDVSVPVGAENTKRLDIARHQKIEALFVVVKLVGPSLKGCDPATASGLLIQGYVHPIGTFHFVARQLRDVCFDTGVGRNVLDYGVVWRST
jgi:hypothetical protein